MQILSRTISSVLDKKVVLTNGYIARPISVGSSWNQIRIGMRLAIDLNGLAVDFTPQLYIGMCSGATNVAGTQTPTNYFGMSWLQSRLLTTSGNVTSQSGGSGMLATKIVNGVKTDSVGLGTFAISNAPATLRSLFVVEITKGSPNYTLGVFSPSVVGAGSDQTQNTLETVMEQVAMSLSNHAQDTKTLAFDEVAGALDTVCVYWNLASRKLEVSEVLHTIVS